MNLNDCDKNCINCIKRYKKKHSLKPGQNFNIKCNGIPKDFVPSKMLQVIGQDEADTARAMLDPVTWAATTLDWHCLDPDGSVWKRKNPNEYYSWLAANPDTPILGKSRYHREYQSNLLRCNSKRKIIRIGRQCLTASSRITLANGQVISIKDIKLNDKLTSLHESSGRIQDNPIFNISPLDSCENTYQIKTKFGHIIECTSDHDFYIIQKYTDCFNEHSVSNLSKEWLSINDGIQPGNKIAVAAKINIFGNQSIGAWASFFGLFLSNDSVFYNQSIKLTNTNLDYLLRFENICKKLGINVSWYKKDNEFNLVINNEQEKLNIIRDKLQELNITTESEKFIPKIIFTAPKEEIKEFLQWFWAGNGYISTFKKADCDTYCTEIGTLQKSKQLLQDLQQLLYRFGCHSYIKPKGNRFCLAMSDKFSINNFLKEIGDIPGKEAACIRAKQVSISDEYLHIENDILWDYITEIKPLGKKQVYDIEVAGDHNFIANGIIAHNCGKSEALVISVLFHMFTKPGLGEDEGFKVILITPFQTQIELIFGRIMELIKANHITANSVKRHVKAPNYTLELYNGSMIKGFTAGTKSGGNADSVRGQHGHMLVFDEADYLCLSKNTIVEKENGELLEIKKLRKNDKILSFQNKTKIATVSQVEFSKSNKLFSFHSCYAEIESTENHKHFILNNKGVSEVVSSEIQKDDFFIIPKQGIIGNKEVDVNLCEIAGYYWGDGNKAADYYNNNKYWNTFVFTDKDKNNLDIYKNKAIKLGFSNKGSINKDSNTQGYRLVLSEKNFLDKFKHQFNKLYFTKELTSEVSTLSHKSLCGFLRGAFDAEGSVNLQRNSVVFSQSNKQHVRIFRLLLQKIGILSSLSEHKPTGFGKRPVFQLSIAEDRFIYLFSEYIGFNSTIKKEKLLQCVQNRKNKNNNYSNLQYPASYCTNVFLAIKDQVKQKFSGKQIIFDVLNRNSNPTLNSLEKLKIGLDKIGHYSLANQVCNLYEKFYASKINSVTIKEKENFKTVDISVPETESFFANGVLTHNCSGDIDSAMSIITNFPEASVWMSSTPTGKREKFYNTCFSKIWKEFHYTSHANPLWSEDKELMFREQLTEVGYRHEILAEFSEQEEGVFQNNYIQKAKAEYKYGDYFYQNTWTYTIGVDWNDTTNGTTINVLGFNPARNKFIIVDRYIVSRNGWTQLSACDKIAELNRIWRPIAIYIDKGFGTVQDEILRKFGYDSMIDPTKGPTHPDSKLKDIVFAYDFGSKVETRDIFTKMPVMKDSKPFLVESTIRRFESADIEFSKYDTELEEQLLGYIIERVTQSGRPVYSSGQKGDHALDALMLSVVAFILEVTPQGKPKYSSHIAFSGQIGEFTDMEIYEGDTVVIDKSSKNSQQRRTRPDMNRTETSTQQSLLTSNGLPANHVVQENAVGLWSWPGFGSDTPKPRIKSLSESENDSRQRMGFGRRRASKPRRKNI